MLVQNKKSILKTTVWWWFSRKYSPQLETEARVRSRAGPTLEVAVRVEPKTLSSLVHMVTRNLSCSGIYNSICTDLVDRHQPCELWRGYCPFLLGPMGLCACAFLTPWLGLFSPVFIPIIPKSFLGSTNIQHKQLSLSTKYHLKKKKKSFFAYNTNIRALNLRGSSSNICWVKVVGSVKKLLG